MLVFSSPSNGDTSTKLKQYCKYCINNCVLYPKYHTRIKPDQSALLQKIINSCNELQQFLEKFEKFNVTSKNCTANLTKFYDYANKLTTMDQQISEVFKKDSDEQIALHGVFLNALKMNTIFRGDNPNYDFESQIKERINAILEADKAKHLLNDKQLNIVNALLALCNNLNTDIINFEEANS